MIGKGKEKKDVHSTTGEANARQGETYRTKNSQIQIIKGGKISF